MRFKNQTVAVVGGATGVGAAVARAAAAEGAAVIVSSRNEARIAAAADEIGGRAIRLDMTDDASMAAWAAASPALDHLVITASSAAHGPFATMEDGPLRAMFDAKFFGPYAVARAALPKLRAGGSITFFSGVLSRRPGANCAGLGAVNGAVEALARAAALELGPELRVNCVSPGMVRSEAYAAMEEAAREAMYRETGASLPVGRVGEVGEAAGATLMLMENAYVTGVVLDVDGGHMIRQYATR